MSVPRIGGRFIRENEMPMQHSDKILSIAKQVFTSFPRYVTGLKFFTMDCGCIYCLRVSRDGVIDYSHVGVYRNEEKDHCVACMDLKQNWGERLVDETVVYSSKFQFV
jgi:hypothetical protein